MVMASLASTMIVPSTSATLLRPSTSSAAQFRSSLRIADGLRVFLPPRVNKIPVRKERNGLKSYRIVSCSVAQPETLQVVQSTIAKQLSIDESSITPQTKFSDLGADSLDTVEIMMALEEKFEVSIGESGAENIATVQDAADLIEKVKAAAA